MRTRLYGVFAGDNEQLQREESARRWRRSPLGLATGCGFWWLRLALRGPEQSRDIRFGETFFCVEVARAAARSQHARQRRVAALGIGRWQREDGRPAARRARQLALAVEQRARSVRRSHGRRRA